MKTYLDEDIIYYGPHPCERCGHMIVKMGKEFGGNSFDQPLGPVYPNHRRPAE